jgi:hypothetical protein
VLAFEPAQREVCMTLGYPVFGQRAIRADLIERIDGMLAQSRQVPDKVLQWLGCEGEALDSVLNAFGYTWNHEQRLEKRG